MFNDRLTLTLPPTDRWLQLLDTAARAYWNELGFSEPLQDMLAGSLNEAGEEFVRICREQNIEETFEVVLDLRDEAAVIQFVYDRRVPLNPLETENYEVPSSLDDIEAPDMDALWLHLIKRRMDRVFFSLEGTRRSLQMMKYRRGEGKTRQLWVMGLAPALRAGLTLELQASAHGGEFPEGLLRDPRSGAVLHLDAGSAFIVGRMDGETAFQEIYMDYIDHIGVTSPQRFALLYERLESMDMLARPGDAHEGRFQRVARHVLNPRVSLPDADGFMERLHGLVSPLVSPWGSAVILAVGLSGLYPFLTRADAMLASIHGMKGYFLSHPWMLIPVYALLFIMAVSHELAHGIVCKHYGGRVDRMGIMFYLAIFIFYCDTSSAWNFREKRKRVMVSLAGPLATFAFLGLSLWMWGLAAGTGSALEMTGAALAVLSLVTLAMNFNPFIRMDAYYVLMDLSGIQNLRTRSFAYLRGLGGVLLGAEKTSIPELNASPRERWFFIVYGLFGGMVSAVFFIWPLVHYARSYARSSGASGSGLLLMAAAVLLAARIGLATWRRVHARSHRIYKIT